MTAEDDTTQDPGSDTPDQEIEENGINRRPESNGANEKFELFKLEYERAAERYENIYRAIWQNFYYMAVLAGGIIAFGPTAIPLSFLVAVALVPLVVWFWATYLPMDRYGQLTRARLGFIEEIFNQTSLKAESRNIGSQISYVDQLGTFRDYQQMRHYQLFYGPVSGGTSPERPIKPYYRVRRAICVFGVIVTTSCVLSVGWYVSHFFAWTLGQSVGWPNLTSACYVAAVLGVTLIIMCVVWWKIVWMFSNDDVLDKVKWWIMIANVVVFGVIWFAFFTTDSPANSKFYLESDPQPSEQSSSQQ